MSPEIHIFLRIRKNGSFNLSWYAHSKPWKVIECEININININRINLFFKAVELTETISDLYAWFFFHMDPFKRK